MYRFHYNVEPQAAYFTNCGSLAREITKKFQPQPLEGEHDSGSESDRDGFLREVVESDSDSEECKGGGPRFDDAAAVFDDAKLWAEVAHLRWAMASDRVIDDAAAAATFANLAANYTLSKISLAMCLLIRATRCMHPTLAHVDNRLLCQLVALGRDMVNTAGNSPEFFEFVKTELQETDLLHRLAQKRASQK